MGFERISVIGAGNMAKAILEGILDTGLIAREKICVTAPSQASRDVIQRRYGLSVSADNSKAVQEADLVILAVKPYVMEAVLAEIAPSLAPRALVLSIAAGKSLSWLTQQLGEDRKIARAMPNTPAMVKEGMTALCANDKVSQAERADLLAIFNAMGRAQEIPESLMDAVTGISGSSPAYIYMLLEAMADAGVLAGMPRSQAYTFAAQSVLGAAKMLLETGLTPAQLKDQVTSPKGTTIAGMRTLEQGGFRGLVMDGILRAVERSEELGRV